jgi:PAS domain S-box-containing protein
VPARAIKLEAAVMPEARPGLLEPIVAIARDDTSQAWLAILDQMPVGVTVSEIPGDYILQNTAARQILGRAPGPGIETGSYLHFGPSAGESRPYEAHEFPLSRAISAGEIVEREPMYYRHPDGRTLILEVNAAVVATAQRRRLGVCTFQDVTCEYEARRALKQAIEHVELALDAGAIIGTYVWNVPADVMTADELFADSFGLDPERCRAGIPVAEAVGAIHPDDQPNVHAAVADALARGGPYRKQYRVRQRHGGYRWIEASGRVEMDESGHPVRFPGILLDITAWKHADEARALLMREVDHRARNMLAVVQSVVRLTDCSDPVRYREEVIGRIDAIARAQFSLAHTNWEGAGLAEVVGAELGAYAAPARFKLKGPRITLPAEQVQPLNMIVHEMVTNAVKYGALSDAAGDVAVSWRRHRGRLELVWKERGGPPSAPPRRQGFGSRLIERLATQIGASTHMNWDKAGLKAQLTWPLPS